MCPTGLQTRESVQREQERIACDEDIDDYNTVRLIWLM